MGRPISRGACIFRAPVPQGQGCRREAGQEDGRRVLQVGRNEATVGGDGGRRSHKKRGCRILCLELHKVSSISTKRFCSSGRHHACPREAFVSSVAVALFLLVHPLLIVTSATREPDRRQWTERIQTMSHGDHQRLGRRPRISVGQVDPGTAASRRRRRPDPQVALEAGPRLPWFPRPRAASASQPPAPTHSAWTRDLPR
mmetsp:Transcript_13970/g.52165  ORF Transcript_13970/g.52165 Transcript_13970/m.52165 type:complete len:200 (+) Transcript_13970:881-1480(+)